MGRLLCLRDMFLLGHTSAVECICIASHGILVRNRSIYVFDIK